MHGPQQMCGSLMSRKSALSQGTTRVDQLRRENKHPLGCEQSDDVTALITQRGQGLLKGQWYKDSNQ